MVEMRNEWCKIEEFLSGYFGFLVKCRSNIFWSREIGDKWNRCMSYVVSSRFMGSVVFCRFRK